MTVLYEDNHIIAVNKTCNEIVQGDKTGDTPLSEIVKAYIKVSYRRTLNCSGVIIIPVYLIITRTGLVSALPAREIISIIFTPDQ